jgi:serine protease Do
MEPKAMIRTALISVLLIVLSSVHPSFAHDSNDYDRKTPIVKTYEKTHKAVVSISGERTIATSIWPGFDFPDMSDFFGPGVQRQIAVLGSGVVVHKDGYIITNAHVAEDSQTIKVSFSDGRDYEADVISTDKDKDLAVLKVQTTEKLPFVQIGRSNDLMIGETVIAIGNPYGYENTLTSGVISATGRDIQVTDNFWLRGLIQTDAPINPGNSGGPLLNINGLLIGVTTAIRAEAQNIGFAIPVDTLVDNLREMLMPENLRRVNIGLITGRAKTAGKFTGLAVDSITKNSPADKAGINEGDILLKIDDKDLSGVLDFYIAIMQKQIGQSVTITYTCLSDKNPKEKTAKLKLVEKPLPDAKILTEKFFQMQISELTERIAQKFGYNQAYPILIITKVLENGSAAETGLKEGDLILQVNDRAPANLKELALVMEKINEGDLVRLKIMRIAVTRFGQVQRQFIVKIKANTKKIKQLL